MELNFQERKAQLVAAFHTLTGEMQRLGLKYTTVIYDETSQDDGSARMATVGNIPTDLQFWMIKTFVETKATAVDFVHISDPQNTLPA